jgi:hypothetical protein
MYDDLYLRQMLASLQSQLAKTHAIDQATLLSHIGVAQGASLSQTSTALSASGMATPGISTFGLASGVPAFSYPPGYTGPPSSSGSSGANPPTAYPSYPTGTATATTPGTTTTIGSATPTAPTPQAPFLTLPASSMGQSSLDTYNESLQLSAEITNTALLLQGSLNDTVGRDGTPKTTVTVGFPVTIEAPSIHDKDLAGAVAEVHVSICSNSVEEPPSIVTLLPQERTYNVAGLVEKDFGASASAILGGVINVGGGFFSGHQTYYLVQQQETVAFLSPAYQSHCATNAQQASFAWQIRPVLGNSVNFVQIAVPSVLDTGNTITQIGEACVSIVWRRPAITGFFRKKSDEYLGRSSQSDEQCYPINYYNTLTSKDDSLEVTDIGGGLITVKALGTFFPGTTVRLGNTYLSPDAIAATHDLLKFTAPASAIVAAGDVFFVGRDGREIHAQYPKSPKAPLAMDPPTITPYSDTQSQVIIDFTPPGPTSSNPAINPWVVVIGSKVFGLSDAPFFSQSDHQIQILVPTSLIQSSPRVELRRLLFPDRYRASRPILAQNFSKAAPSVSATSILSSQKGLTIGLVGTGLDTVKMVFPADADCPGCKMIRGGSTFLGVIIPKPATPKKTDKPEAKDTPPPTDPTDGLKQLAFCKLLGDHCDNNFPPIIVSVPKLDSPAAKPSLDSPDPVPVNTAQISITGAMLDQVVSIEHAKLSLPFRLIAGKKPSLTVDLPPAIASVPGGYGLLITFADKSTAGCLLTIKKAGS